MHLSQPPGDVIVISGETHTVEQLLPKGGYAQLTHIVADTVKTYLVFECIRENHKVLFKVQIYDFSSCFSTNTDMVCFNDSPQYIHNT